MSEKYFGRIGGINLTATGRDLTVLRSHFSKACPCDHIRYTRPSHHWLLLEGRNTSHLFTFHSLFFSFIAKPLHVEVNQKCEPQQQSTTCDVTLGAAEVVEALYGRTSATREFISMLYDEEVPPEYCEVSGLSFLSEKCNACFDVIYEDIVSSQNPSCVGTGFQG